ncbi:MAG: hypothetical protein V3W18_00840 [candidate division Zixibacteria bacterium]
MLVLLIFACEGKQGPIGPQGPAGPEGSSGAPILYYDGLISAQTYDQYGYINIEHYLITDEDVVQVYFSPNPNVYTWLSIPLFELTDGGIYVYDPDHTFEDWQYLIMIIKDNDG